MLKKLFCKHGRRRSSELAASLTSLKPGELVREIVELFTAGELRLRSRDQKRPLCARFYDYRELNPQVGGWFLRAARELKHEEHREHYAIGALAERIRHHVEIGIIKADCFKISNDFRACYAREILMRDPSLLGLFQLKPSCVDTVLVIDGRSWSDFSKEHEADLWPERAAKKPSSASQADLPLSEEAA
jgi:hypothetical protein